MQQRAMLSFDPSKLNGQQKVPKDRVRDRGWSNEHDLMQTEAEQPGTSRMARAMPTSLHEPWFLPVSRALLEDLSLTLDGHTARLPL